jgi:hypothetical protein
LKRLGAVDLCVIQFRDVKGRIAHDVSRTQSSHSVEADAA